MARHKKYIVVKKQADKNNDLKSLIYKIYEDFIVELMNPTDFNYNEYKKSKNNRI